MVGRLSRRSTEAICAALLPPEAGGPAPTDAADDLDRYLTQVPSITAKGIRAGLIGLDAAARVMAHRSLSELDADARVGVLERIAGARPEMAMALDGLKALVMLSHGAGTQAAEMHRRAARFAPARPDAELDIRSSLDEMAVVRCDAVVVGSGAGGAFVARTLARAGLDVVILEEGRRWRVDDLRDGHPIDRFAGLYRDGGTTIALGRPPVVLPIGRAVGGTTVVNSGTCYRPPIDVQRRWRDDYGLAMADPDALAPHLDEVESTLKVGAVPPSVMGRNGELLLAGAARQGWSSHPIARNAPDCVGSCQCAIGCPRNAKFGVHLNALPQACSAGARIISHARVTEVLHRAGRATGVAARRPDGSEFVVSARTVVVAAGAAETPALLWRSSLGDHPRIGRNLSLHPALGLAGRFPEPVVAWEGVLQSAAVDELHRSHGILIEATSTPPGMGSMVLPGYGRELVERLADADHIAVFGAMIADEPSGRVLGRRLGRPLMRYDLARADADRLVHAMAAMGRLMFAAGAEEVLTALPRQPSVTSVAELDAAIGSIDPLQLHLAAFHPTGTAGAGSDDQVSPVDEHGRLRGTTGLWVADATILPSCPEVNPQVSIMALALAVGDEILACNR
jgi:choline dehydrogenase-like flavoprotein